jgi:hypothetical protein
MFLGCRFCKVIKQVRWHPFVVGDDTSMTEWRLRLLLPERLAVPAQRMTRAKNELAKPAGRPTPGPALESEQPEAEALATGEREADIWLGTGIQHNCATPDAFAFDDAGDDYDAAGPLETGAAHTGRAPCLLHAPCE